MCLPPVNRIQRAAPLQHVQPIAKQQQQQQQAEQQSQQQELQLDTAPLPELFLKTDFQPELLMPELLSPSSCVSSISAPASSPSSAAGSASSSATSPMQQVPALAEVDLSWLDQDLLTSLEPLPLVEEQQSFQPQQTLLPAAATLTFEPSLHLDLVGDDEDEDDDMDEMDGQTTTFLPRHLADDDDEDDEDDNEEFHILSPDSNSTSGSDSKAAARKTKNRKRKLACDLSADELAKTREINRIAAQRHRQAAKAKRVERQRRFDDMGKRNEILREQVRDMSAELKTLRRLIVDMYSPNGSRHLQLMAPSTPIDFSFLGLA